MNFCSHCGAPLVGGAASFCSECGKPLRQQVKPDKPRSSARSESRIQKPKCNTQRQVQQRLPKNPMDENYDGYYDDVPTVDADRVSEGLDPVLLKRILLLILGAVAVIGLTAALMLLL